jgi:hypothetical protein
MDISDLDTDWGSGVPRNFFRGWGGVQQIQLRTENREKGDLGAAAVIWYKKFHFI